MLQAFRIISFIEGLSFIALLFVAMPAKYGFGLDWVAIAGPVHGVLWLLFLPLLELSSRQQAWPQSIWNYAFFTSILPFGCFFLERRFRSGAVPGYVN